MDYDRKYLELTNFGFGTPTDMSDLRVGDKIIQINGRNVSDLTDTEEFLKNINDQWLKLSIKRIGIKDSLIINVPRVSIDLNSGNYRTEGNLFISLDIRQKVVKMPTGYDLEKNKNELIEIVNATPDPSLYQVYDVFGGAGCDYRLMEKRLAAMLEARLITL